MQKTIRHKHKMRILDRRNYGILQTRPALKMKKKTLHLSILLNIALIIALAVFIQKSGGISSIGQKIGFSSADMPSRLQIAQKTKQSIFEIMPKDSTDILFIGDSHIEYCHWAELFPSAKIKNRGLAGDVIQGVSARLDEALAPMPSKIFLMIGTNDLYFGHSVDQLLEDYEVLIQKIKQKAPESRIYIHSIPPSLGQTQLSNNDIRYCNDKLHELAKYHSLVFINIFDLLKDLDGKLNAELTYDGLHLNGKGYRIWKEALEKHIEKQTGNF